MAGAIRENSYGSELNPVFITGHSLGAMLHWPLQKCSRIAFRFLPFPFTSFADSPKRWPKREREKEIVRLVRSF